LPASPAHGQECYYRFQQTVAPVDAKWTVWHLRWDSQDNAWLPVGEQAPIFAFDQTSRGTAFSANTWGNCAVEDPQVTLPRAGEYRLAWGVASSLSSATINQWCGIAVAGVDPLINGTNCASGHGAGNTWEPGPRGEVKASALAVGTLVKMRFLAQTTASTLTRAGAYVMAWPRRITG